MTILFFSRLFYPHIGGVEKHVLEISKLLLRKRYSVVVISEQHASDLKLHEYYQGIEIYRIPVTENWFKKFCIWLWLLKHQQLIKSSDIIHCHDVFFWYLPFRFLFPSKKVFTTFHGYESYPIKKRMIIVRKFSEILSYGTICIGEFMKKWYFAKPTFISYGGVDIKKWKIESSKLKENNNMSAVFVGRLDEQTGIKTYIKAYELLRKKNKEFKLTIVGDGKYANIIPFNVNHIKNETNVFPYFQKARFAFVSRYLSILEAIAAKKLVFAVYDNPLKKDYLTVTPFKQHIVVAKNSHDLYKQILYFQKNKKEEKQKINKAYQWVVTQTWEKLLFSYLKLWDKKK